MSDYADFEEQRIKHLDMIQAVIARLGNNSFFMKGWALTIAGVFFGFAVDSHSRRLALAALIPTAIFWGLDTYFLRCERLFRCLYGDVRDRRVEPFFMNATDDDYIKGFQSEKSKEAASRWRAFRSATLALFYGGIMASAVAVALFVSTTKPHR